MRTSEKIKIDATSFIAGVFPNILVADILVQSEIDERLFDYYQGKRPKVVYKCCCRKTDKTFYVLPRALVKAAKGRDTVQKRALLTYEDIIETSFVLSASDYIGKKYNHLTIINFVNPCITGDAFISPDEQVMCQCDCPAGNQVVTTIRKLVGGSPRSCGCEHSTISDGCVFFEDTQSYQSRERLYGVWASIRARCYNERRKDYALYGGRGITMCKSWRENYVEFRKWALENGYDPNAPKGKCTIDRIDNNRGYKPSNCRWVSTSEQNTNKVNTLIYSYYGREMNARGWSKYLNIDYQELLTMLHQGMSIGQIIKKHKLQNTGKDYKEKKENDSDYQG